jgi:tRNA(adenine34) deaminase
MTHEDYMKEALQLAKEAGETGDVPVGCVIVRGGEIIAKGRNRREKDQNALGHAELEAIRQACEVLGGWRLSGCRLYVTLEPCPMCAGGIISARIPEVYYGAKDSGIGACGSVLNLFEEGFRHRPKLVGGILQEECKAELSKFFQHLRKNSENEENLKFL